MLKKIVLFAALAVSTASFGQKIAYVSTQEIFAAMPDLKRVESEMASINENYKVEITKMEEEYAKKYKEFQESADSLTQNIKLRRMQEVQELQQRIENFYQVAQEDIRTKQEEKLAPIQKKIQDAIKEVGKDQGYTYILDKATLLHIGNDAIDATPIVKTKLDIK